MKKTDNLANKSAANTPLQRARVAKNDEFYTRRESIESELRHYRPHFAGKVVYCNCDDPTISEFYQFFKRNFELLKLKRLITTCYKSKDPFGWTKYKDENGLRIDYDGKKQRSKKLKKDGDFSSPECVSLLQEADIVVTNPPFSLFRKYVAQLVENSKKFLIIGNFDAVSYKDIFSLIMAERLWIGMSPRSMDFDTPKDGPRCINAAWFTNLSHQKRNEELILTARYKDNESSYPKYENYDAIEVSKVAKIPRDYAGVMGVPVTFWEKWNPKQFEILGFPENMDIYGLKTRTYTAQEKKNAYFAKFGKSGIYDLDARGVLVKSGILHAVYGRVFIRNKGLQK